MSARIASTDKDVDRHLYVGEGENDTVELHWYGGTPPSHPEFRNFNLREFVAAVNTLPGVTASLERRAVPKGIGAVVALSSDTRLVRTDTGDKHGWAQNSGSIAGWYDDKEIDYYLNDSLTFSPIIESEGVL